MGAISVQPALGAAMDVITAAHNYCLQNFAKTRFQLTETNKTAINIIALGLDADKFLPRLLRGELWTKWRG